MGSARATRRPRRVARHGRDHRDPDQNRRRGGSSATTETLRYSLGETALPAFVGLCESARMRTMHVALSVITVFRVRVGCPRRSAGRTCAGRRPGTGNRLPPSIHRGRRAGTARATSRPTDAGCRGLAFRAGRRPRESALLPRGRPGVPDPCRSPARGRERLYPPSQQVGVRGPAPPAARPPPRSGAGVPLVPTRTRAR